MAGVARSAIPLNIVFNGRYSGGSRNLDKSKHHAGLLPVFWRLPLPVAYDIGQGWAACGCWVGQAWAVALILITLFILRVSRFTGHFDEENYILFAV